MRLLLFRANLHRSKTAQQDQVTRVATATRRFAWSAIFPMLLLLSALLILSPKANAETPTSIQMKLLVISADGKEPSFAAIQSILQQIGVPYDTLIASTTPFTARTLSNGLGAGNYQGILLATGNLGYVNSLNEFVSAFTDAQWQALWKYEADFRVRQATLYTFPGGVPDSYGLTLNSGVDTTTTSVQTQLTAAGKTVFSYLNSANPISIKNAWTYLATPVTSSNPVTLLKTDQGHAIASIYTYPNGRQNLAITADGNPNLTHTLALGYGIINWVSKGIFLGARKVILTAQPDDVMIPDDMWDPAKLTDQSGITFRMSGSDLQSLALWQKNFRVAHPVASQLILEMPFNAVGATGHTNDTLTPAIKALSGSFKWISHTYTHANLDAITYTDATTELRLNNNAATSVTQLNLKNYFRDSMIQPDISGLNNPEFLRAARDFGIRFILSDTSQLGWKNPSPNVGFYSVYQPSILIIPRYPTNLYYNVSTPAEWVSEYNHFYAPGGLFPAWDHPLTYAEVLDKESEVMLSYLLKYDTNPLMFHQPNLRAYDGVNSLLGDLIKATVAKYEKLFTLPISSPGQHELGLMMIDRMAYNASGVKATLMLGQTNTIKLQTVKAVTAPLTGVSGINQQIYGGQTISNIKLGDNGQMTVPGPAW